MKSKLRNLRGALGVALVSGAAWALVMFVIYGLAAFDAEFSGWSLRNLWRFPAAAGVFGFVTGGVLAGGLRIMSRNQRWERIRASRAALLGVAASVAGFGFFALQNLLSGGPALPDDALVGIVLVGLLGGGVSVAMVKIAQSAPSTLETQDATDSLDAPPGARLSGE